MLIIAFIAAWLFVVVLAMALLRSAALADRAAASEHARKARDHATERRASERRATRVHAAVLVVALLVPLSGIVAPVAGADVAPVAIASQAPDARCPGGEAAPDAAERAALDATLCLINRERADRALAPLDLDSRLTVAARRHSADMVARGYFSHVTPGGSTLADRLRRAGYTGHCAWRAGETLAWGSGTLQTPSSRVRAWMDSRRHREVLLDPAYRDVGIGIAAGLPGRSGEGFTYSAELGRRRC